MSNAPMIEWLTQTINIGFSCTINSHSVTLSLNFWTDFLGLFLSFHFKSSQKESSTSLSSSACHRTVPCVSHRMMTALIMLLILMPLLVHSFCRSHCMAPLLKIWWPSLNICQYYNLSSLLMGESEVVHTFMTVFLPRSPSWSSTFLIK